MSPKVMSAAVKSFAFPELLAASEDEVSFSKVGAPGGPELAASPPPQAAIMQIATIAAAKEVRGLFMGSSVVSWRQSSHSPRRRQSSSDNIVHYMTMVNGMADLRRSFRRTPHG
jgi:hypothetical protein